MEIKKRYFRSYVQLTSSDKEDGWHDLFDMVGVYYGQVQFKF